ncbi:TIR-like protein FxsC [Streptomyces sp. C1-2]|uniref:TIR-like protein FxsC n=1 Tax=Streptomyces sp. C1-2 TaxID=2720022 RepID=UPI003211D3C5
MSREPYFFLSYARRDDPEDAFVSRFYEDLVNELRRLEVDCSGQMSFLDVQRLSLGDDWERRLGREVGRCRALVALCSPAYTHSLYCGKEWAAFRSRVDHYRAQTTIDVPALIPVVWTPPRGAWPEEIARLHYAEPEMGTGYLEHGLMGLLRTDPRAYRRALKVIAERVQHVAELFRLPVVDDLDLATVRSPFPDLSTATSAERSTPHVRLFVAAGVSESLPVGRRRPEYYGRSPLDWAPYHPPAVPTLANRAQRVILDEDCVSSVEVVGRDLGERLDEAMGNNQPSVLLVDAWAACGDPYREALSAYDRQNHPHAGVLVPCDEADDESEAEELWAELHEVFPRNWLRRNDLYDRLFQIRVDRRHFDAQLAVMVTVAQSRLMKKAQPRRLPAGPLAPPMPGLMVPAPLPPADAERHDPPGPAEGSGHDDD